jgi:choline kinase
MRGVILAAGVGKRLGGAVIEHPKCLLSIGERTLLERMLDALSAVGVNDITIVVGHMADQIERAVAGRGVRTLFNPEYRKGAILSLWTARECLDADVLIMDADVLFPTGMLERLVRSRHGNCFLMDRRAADDGEAQLLMALDGRVRDIARGVRGPFDEKGESVGFLKLDAPSAATLRSLLGQALEGGRDGIEHEEVYPSLMRECVISYETVDDLPWMEIDFPEDVIAAEALLEAHKVGNAPGAGF